MASGAREISAAVAVLVLAPLAALALQPGLGLRAADLAALRFTVTQAALSALISCVLAVPLARALMRRAFPGRGALMTLLGAPFLLPTIVAVLGIVTVYGRSGWLSQLTGPVPLYGLGGVLLAHVFFNLPLATRILVQGWHAIPAERLRLAATLGLSPWGRFRHVELAMLRAQLPGAVLAIFLVCLTSFVVALTLGGGPSATTIELAIYQALRFDFEPGHAATLAGLQAGLAALAVWAAAWVTLPDGMGAGLDRAPLVSRQGRAQDVAVIALAALFLALPLLAVLVEGLPGLAQLPAQVWPAAGRSLAVALAAAVLATVAALPLALAAARGSRLAEVTAMLPMVASGLVLGTGWFLLLRPVLRPETVALPTTILANGLMALPFLLRLLLPEARRLSADYDRLARATGLTGWARLRFLTLPRLARPLGLGAGIAAALSMGDLGTIALFADQDQATLPLVVQRLAGAYRMEAASGAALLLVALSFTLFALFDLGGRRLGK